MSILETMSRGIPNISTKIASIPEVIESGVQGILIEPGDIQALTEALGTLCGDREIRERMSRESHSLIRDRFSVNACGRKLEGIYRKVLERQV